MLYIDKTRHICHCLFLPYYFSMEKTHQKYKEEEKKAKRWVKEQFKDSTKLKTFNSLFSVVFLSLSFRLLSADTVWQRSNCLNIYMLHIQKYRTNSAFCKPIIENHRFIMTFSAYCCTVSRQCVIRLRFGCRSWTLLVRTADHCSMVHFVGLVFFVYLNTRVRVDCSHLCNFPLFPLVSFLFVCSSLSIRFKLMHL